MKSLSLFGLTLYASRKVRDLAAENIAVSQQLLSIRRVKQAKSLKYHQHGSVFKQRPSANIQELSKFLRVSAA